jgi:IS1 family transposase
MWSFVGKKQEQRWLGSAIHVMLPSQNRAHMSLLFNRLWNGIGPPALHG